MEQIVIQQIYFDNIKKAVDAINEFFASGFEVKNFPTDKSNLEYSIAWIIDILNDLDTKYVKDQQTIEDITDDIIEKINNEMNGDMNGAMVNRDISNAVNSIVAYSALQTISENFDSFSKLINGIYTFELFMKPSQYVAELDLFSENVQVPTDLEEMDVNVPIFSIQEYVSNLMMGCALVKFPADMEEEAQIQRMLDHRDLENTEVVISKSTAIQEAADESLDVPAAAHIKYNAKEKKFEVSKQLETAIDKLMAGIEKCNTVEELKDFFKNASSPDILFKNVCPYLLTQVYTDEKLYDGKIDASASDLFTSVYMKKQKDDGAKRFKNYDIFTTFKADKEGTVKFIEDFLKLRLFNDSGCAITNNIILTIFNIFDSRLYLDTLYNLLPPEEKKEKSEDAFVKETRARINKNSRAANVYQPDVKKESSDQPLTSKEVQEYVYKQLDMFGDMTFQEMQTCNQYQQMLIDEISTVDDAIYNNRMSPLHLDRIAMEAFVSYKKRGDIPTYMKGRMQISDDDEAAAMKKSPDTIEVPDPEIPPPDNSIDELADSVNGKMNMDGEMDEVMGSGFDKNPEKEDAKHVVYNITYTNSFNKDSRIDSSSHNTSTNDLSNHVNNDLSNHVSNDLSTGKTTTTTNANRYHTTSTKTKTIHAQRGGSNNYSNNSDSLDSKDSTKQDPSDGRTFSNGMSVQEMFAFLEAEEPLSSESSAMKGTSDSLTDAVAASNKKKAEREAKRKEREATRANRKSQGGPIRHVKAWLTDIMNSVIQRDEDAVKAEIIENPSYRTSLFKAGRVAIKLGLVGVAFTISGVVGAAALGVFALRHADKTRLRREVSEEFMTEIKILDEKIDYIKSNSRYEDDPAKRKQMYQMMRLRSQMVGICSDIQKNRWRRPDAYEKTRY